MGDQDLVRGVLIDLESSALPDKEKALFRFLRRVNHQAREIDRSEVSALRGMGWSDGAIYDAITVCALFNFYNRWCDATGARDMPAAAYEASGARLAKDGYNVPPRGAPDNHDDEGND